MKETIPTSKGELTIPEVMSELIYQAYEANRENGTSHESLVKFGIGNETMKKRYDNFKKQTT